MAIIFDFESAAEFLLSELDLRKQRNKGYSQRAYARDLGISASQLSEILRGRAGMSEAMALCLAEKLKLKPTEKKFWLDLVLATATRNENIKGFAKERLTKSRKLSRLKEINEAQFRVVSEWYHSAILEMTELKRFRMDPAWIAGELGITVSEAVDAILRLKKLKLIFENDGRWQSHPEAYEAFSKTPSVAIRKFHQQILRKSIDSIENVDLNQRHIHSMILAIPKSHLPQFGDKIKAFLQDFWEDLQGTEKDELYTFSVQMIPIRSDK